MMQRLPRGKWYCEECRKERCAMCGEPGIGIDDNIICGDEEETKGCGRVFHLVEMGKRSNV